MFPSIICQGPETDAFHTFRKAVDGVKDIGAHEGCVPGQVVEIRTDVPLRNGNGSCAASPVRRGAKGVYGFRYKAEAVMDGFLMDAKNVHFFQAGISWISQLEQVQTQEIEPYMTLHTESQKALRFLIFIEVYKAGRTELSVRQYRAEGLVGNHEKFPECVLAVMPEDPIQYRIVPNSSSVCPACLYSIVRPLYFFE